MDRFGRKRPLYIGLAGYLFASVACAFATSIEALIVLRFVQAVCSCAAAVASVAMVRDLFPVEDNAKVFSLLMLVVGVSPMIAPTVGGYVTAGFGWEAVFLILAAMAAVILTAVYLGLPESSQPDPSYSLKPKPIISKFLLVIKEPRFYTYALSGAVSFKPKPIISKFLLVIKEPRFYTYALSGAVSFAGLLAYVSGSPLLFMELFQVNEKEYGWIFAFLSIGLIGASQVNSIMLRRYRSEQIIVTALVCQLAIGAVLLLGTMNGWLGLFSTIACIFLFLCCLGFTFPNASALSLAPFTKNAGSASALMGATQMGIGALATVILSLFSNHSAVPMAGVMAASALVSLLILLLGQKVILTKGLQYQTGNPAAGAMH